MAKADIIIVKDTEITILNEALGEYISITDMLKAKDGDFFVSDWLRNRNTVEFLGIWESVNNPDFNYGEFAIIRSQAGLNNYKISVKEWVEKIEDVHKAQAINYLEAYNIADGLLINFGGLSLEFKRVYNKKLVIPSGNPVNQVNH